jgi:hypothetical protein
MDHGVEMGRSEERIFIHSNSWRGFWRRAGASGHAQPKSISTSIKTFLNVDHIKSMPVRQLRNGNAIICCTQLRYQMLR